MKHVVVIATFILTSFFGFGQKYLEPAKTFNLDQEDLNEYYRNVFQLLYTGFSEKPVARYTSMPSFSNEYAFSIETIEGKQYIVSNSLSESYWYANNKKKVHVISNKAELTNELYQKIVELFKLLEEQKKEHEYQSLGLDGVTYYFATTDESGQVKVGEIWSPNENSVLGALIKICDNIFLLGSGKKLAQSEILNETQELINSLK